MSSLKLILFQFCVPVREEKARVANPWQRQQRCWLTDLKEKMNEHQTYMINPFQMHTAFANTLSRIDASSNTKVEMD